MTDDTEEVTVTSPKRALPKPPAKKGLSPLQTSLLYGGAATAVAGPLGLLAGVGFGLAKRRMDKNYLDDQATHIQNLDDEFGAATENLNREYDAADPDEKRQLDIARRMMTDGYYRLRSGNTGGQELWNKGNDLLVGVVGGDIAQRKTKENEAETMQRGLVTTAANSFRDQYQQSIQRHESVTTQADRVLDLVSQPDFDPNKPFNRAILSELVSTGMGMYRDTPDMLDAVTQGSNALAGIPGGVGVAAAAGGDIIKALVTGVKSKDFVISREDYNRIALNMRSSSQKQSQDQLSRLGNQAMQLDGFARQHGMFTDEFSLQDYITGGLRELTLAPAKTVPVTKPAPRADNVSVNQPGILMPVVSGLNGSSRLIDRLRRPNARPTN